MGFLEDKQKENKTGIFFASVAALIVLLFGIFAGNSITTIILKLFVAGIIFYGIGFGVIILLKSSIPELLENDDEVGNNVDATIEDDGQGEEDRETVEYDQEENTDEYEDEQVESGTEGLTVKKGEDGPQITITTEDGELTEDPETVAKAIRTMMARDED